MCGVVFNLLLAGERLGGGVCREPDRRELTFPHCRSFSFPFFSQSLFLFSDFSFILSLLTPLSPDPLAVSFISSWLLYVCSRLLLSTVLFIILSFVFLLCCHSSLNLSSFLFHKSPLDKRTMIWLTVTPRDALFFNKKHVPYIVSFSRADFCPWYSHCSSKA